MEQEPNYIGAIIVFGFIFLLLLADFVLEWRKTRKK